MNFESTLPLGEPELMRVSAFQRYLNELKREGADESLTRLSSLNPSLLQDLLRFEQDGRHTELLEVLAACVRHARSLAVYMQCGPRVVPLAPLGPQHAPPHGVANHRRVAVRRRALVQHHRNVGAEVLLDVHRLLGGQF